MTISNKIKYTLITLLLGIIALPLYAQNTKTPIQFKPEFGLPVSFLNKDIYSGKPLNISQQYGLELVYQMNTKWALGLEGQYRSYAIQKNVESTYAPMVKYDQYATGTYNNSTLFNGILNIKYTIFSKNCNNLFEISLGGGFQQLNQKENKLQLGGFNPEVGVMAYQEKPTKSMAPIGQLSLQNTFLIKKKIGISLGVKFQYALTKYEVTYTKLPQPTDNPQLDYETFIETPPTTETVKNPFTIIPTIGISIPIGRKLPCNNTNNNDKTCFSLNWANKTDKCFDGEKLNFEISQAPSKAHVLVYEVYLAPYNDLNSQRLLFTLQYPTTTFSIASNLLDADKQYAVIVKSIYPNNEGNCLQYISPIRRCPNACKDTKIPEAKR